MTSPGCTRARTGGCMRSIPSRATSAWCPGTNREDQPQCLRDDPPRHDVHQRGGHRRQRALVGRSARGQAGARLAGAAVRSGERARRAPELAIHGGRAAESRPTRSSRTPPAACRSRRIVFGGRRRSLAPLVYQARNWQHGVLVGAGLASETTAAATGAVGVVRRDPMAMKPFAGYNFGDYWAHWLNVGAKLRSPPRDLSRQLVPPGRAGKFLWPGYGENLRVLRWIIDRCKGAAQAHETAIGHLPRAADLDTRGPRRSRPRRSRNCSRSHPALWRKEFEAHRRIPRGVRRAGAGGAAQRTRAARCAEPRTGAKGAVSRSLFADVADHLRGVAVGRLAEPDQALAANLHGVAAHEGLLAVLADARRCRWCSDRSA